MLSDAERRSNLSQIRTPSPSLVVFPASTGSQLIEGSGKAHLLLSQKYIHQAASTFVEGSFALTKGTLTKCSLKNQA